MALHTSERSAGDTTQVPEDLGPRSAPAARPAGHRFGRRPPLPAPRALLGAALVAAAVVGTFVAAGGGAPPAAPLRVVAAADLAPGEVVARDDLTTTPADLGAADGAAFADPGELVGAVVLAPVAAGELVQAGAVALPVDGAPPAPARQLTLSLERDRALGGHLRPGEQVDVITTLGTGPEAETTVAARRVPVVRIDTADDGLATTVAVTLAPADEDEVVALVHAGEVGAVVLARPGGRS